jgi:hypothetical protein
MSATNVMWVDKIEYMENMLKRVFVCDIYFVV